MIDKYNADPRIEIFKYPAGEFQARLTPEYVDSLRQFPKNKRFVLYGTASNEPEINVMRTALLADAISEVLQREIELFMSYLPYARADRRFCEGDCFGLRTYMRQLAAMPVSVVHTVDVHSDVALTDWPQFLVNHHPKRQIYEAIKQARGIGENLNLIFPDFGAQQRYFEMIRYLSAQFPEDLWHYCEKKRNPLTGAFEGFIVPKIDNDWPCLIVDDLCDGGGTFINIAQELRRFNEKHEVSLYVTHGLFSKGSLRLRDNGVNGKIFCTDTWTPAPARDEDFMYFNGEAPFERDEHVIVLPVVNDILRKLEAR